MKKARLIYNPVAGKKAFAQKLDILIGAFQRKGWQLVPYRTIGRETGNSFARVLKQDNYDAVIIAGGDGTIHHVVNGLLLNGLDIPLGIIPSGTANDFASHLNLPSDLERCCEVILNGDITKVDVGWANNSYFINVASAGLLSDIPHKTDVAMKNVLGKLAYYLKGIEKIPNFRSIPVEISLNSRIYKEEVLLFLILNGRTAGGFNRLAPRASVMDGVFDVIVVKPCNLGQLFAIFLKLIRGEHINDPRVEYFQTDEVIITCPHAIDTDLDGERGPAFPLTVKTLPGRLSVFTPKKSVFEAAGK